MCLAKRYLSDVQVLRFARLTCPNVSDFPCIWLFGLGDCDSRVKQPTRCRICLSFLGPPLTVTRGEARDWARWGYCGYLSGVQSAGRIGGCRARSERGGCHPCMTTMTTMTTHDDLVLVVLLPRRFPRARIPGCLFAAIASKYCVHTC